MQMRILMAGNLILLFAVLGCIIILYGDFNVEYSTLAFVLTYSIMLMGWYASVMHFITQFE